MLLSAEDKEALLADYVQRAVLNIVARIEVAKLEKPGSELKLYAEIENILAQFGLAANEVLPQFLIQDYFAGVDEAAALMAIQTGTAVPTLSLTEAGLIAVAAQKPIHMQALATLIEDTMNDMNAAVRTAQLSSRNTIDRTLTKIRGDISEGIIAGQAQRTTTEAVMKTFREEGMTAFVTADGKKLPLRFYALTVNRTKTRAATVQGSANRYIDAGQDLVLIQSNGDSCKKCSAYSGMVVSLTGKTPGYPVLGQGAVMLPPFHPNCRCSIRLFDLAYESEANQEKAKRKGESFNPNRDERTPAQRAAYEKEQALRVKANAELKQFERWQDTLGAEAPKTLAAFRRMKRQNTVQFQLLSSEYQSRRMILANQLRDRE